MGTPDSTKTPKVRRDGWTAERQLRFLDALARTRSITKAVASVGMSREGAYRLRNRGEGTLFTLLWDRALACDLRPVEIHSQPLTGGQIMRLLGMHYRREREDFASIGSRRKMARDT